MVKGGNEIGLREDIFLQSVAEMPHGGWATSLSRDRRYRLVGGPQAG
jgi:hypothetical protein